MHDESDLAFSVLGAAEEQAEMADQLAGLPELGS
jgi:hypothetical protein